MWVKIKKTYHHYWAHHNGELYFPYKMGEDELYRLRRKEVLYYRSIPLVERIMIKVLCNTITMNLTNNEGFYCGFNRII